MNEIILKTISARYTAAARDMGDLKEIRGGLFRFSCESYSLDGIGNLFFIRMRAMAGLIKMETAVLTPVERDLSFCNFDVVHAAGTHTMIFEMYRTCMEERDLSAFAPIRECAALVRRIPPAAVDRQARTRHRAGGRADAAGLSAAVS